MPNSFLFIIPLTPLSHLTDSRLALRKLCFDTLMSQTYPGWKALIVGKLSSGETVSASFITLDFEGHKEEKLQKATEYILEHQTPGDYIIRLDDDDVFNPALLKKLADMDFDLYVDKYHAFWNSGTGYVSQAVRHWFPNTGIHKRAHALSAFGHFPPGNYTRYRESCRLIENEHNDFHKYYNQHHRVLFSEKNAPVYLRALNSDSITSMQATNYREYLNTFGFWRKNRLRDFLFLNSLLLNGSQQKQSVGFLIRDFKHTLMALKTYYHTVIRKHGV